jgi:alkylation response protein AidB-like acyl-CoA dehydrogenase
MSVLQEDDRLLIQESVEKFVATEYASMDRAGYGDAGARFGEHWSTFAELGWLALPFAEHAGGLGGGVADLQLLLRAFGRGLILEPFTEVLTAGKVLEYCVQADRQAELLASLIAGQTRLVLAHSEQEAEPGFGCVNCTAQAASGGFMLTGVKRVVWQAGAADSYLLSAWLEGEPALFLVAKDADQLLTSEYRTIDSRYAADLDLRGVTVPTTGLLASGEAAATAVKQAILFTYAILIGEVRGISDSLIEHTSAYLNTREQFGSKLGGFQALQHKLADMVVAAEEIRSLEWLVAGAADLADLALAERTIRSARARVGKVSRALAESAVQLHGGIGVSDEFIVGHYLRRVLVIDSYFGDADQQLIWLASQH